MIRALAIVVALGVAALPAGARGDDLPRAEKLEVGAAAPFKGTLLNDEQLRVMDAVLTKAEGDRDTAAKELELYKAGNVPPCPSVGVKPTTLLGAVLLTAVVASAVAFTAGAYVWATRIDAK